MSRKTIPKQTLRRTFLRVLFVAKIDGDRELEILSQGAASALRVSKTEVEADLADILERFDKLLAQLVRDKRLLHAAGVFFPTSQQLDQLSKVWGGEYTAARKFFAETFGDESWPHLDVDRLATQRVEQLVRSS